MAGKAASTPTAARPTTTAVPPARRQSQASRMVSARPTTSKACSAPPPVSSRTAAAGSDERRVDRVRGTARERELEHRGIAVDGHDHAGARQHETRDDLLTDSAAADHRGAITDAHPRDVAHGSDARHGTAPEQRGLPERHVRGQGNDARAVDDRALGEAGDGEAVLQRRSAGQRETRRPVHQRAAHSRLARGAAERRPAAAAGAAGAARRDHAEHHAVAGRNVHDALADRLDGARALVSEHHGPAPVAQASVGQVQIRMADAAGGDADEHFARLGRRQRDLLDAHVAGLAQDDGSHATRQRSSASRSGVTPSPGPAGGAIVPSAAISTTAGSSQSRRSADHAGGSYGTSTNGHVETPCVSWRLQTRP